MELVETELPGCYHLKSVSQYELVATFMRMQEFYESNIDGIRGVYFSIEEFMDAYAKEHGNFTYFVDWVGFNLSSRIIREFYRKFPVKKLTNREKEFKELIAPILKTRRKFCIIGTFQKLSKKEYSTYEHEMAHGLYFLNKKYKKKMDTMLESLGDFKQPCFDILKKKGYDETVYYDELQAYLATSKYNYLKKKHYTKYISKPLVLEFRKVFLEFKSRM